MEPKFTKGKWEIKPSRKRYYARISGKGWSSFAKVVIRMNGFQDLNEEGLANAKLIASAPDLFEALNEIIPFASEWINDNHPSMQKAKEAIKKATE